jgi:hypothetical protein
MRVRFPIQLAALLPAVVAAACAAPAHAVVVQGFTATGSGGVTVSAVTTPSAPPKRLVSSGFPAAATGKVDLTLPHANGIAMTFEEPESPGATIEKRSLTLYTNGAVPGEQIPIIKGSALGSGGSSQRKVSCPYVFTVTIQVWDGPTLMLSKDLPISTVVTVSGGSDVAQAGTELRAFGVKQAQSGGQANGGAGVYESWLAPRDVTVDGETVSGDQLVFEMESADFPDAFDGAELACAPNIAAVLNGNVQIGELSIVKDTPYVTPRMAHGPVRVTLGDDMVHVTDTEDGAITYSLDAAGPGGGGSGVVHLGDPGSRTGRDYEDCRWTIQCPVGWSSFSTEMDVEVDDGSGLPPQKQTLSLTFQGATPTATTMIAFASLVPGDVTTVQAISEGRPVGQPLAAGLGTHVQCSAEPAGIHASGDPLNTSFAVDFPDGTTFDIDGQQFTGNMLHMHSTGTHQRRISDVRIVHPPGTPPSTWRLTGLGISTSPPDVETGGRDLAARGPRQTVSLDGSYSGHNKRVIVPYVPNGGMEMVLNGAPSVAFESAPDAGAPPLPFESLALYECDDGTCDPASSLEIEYDAAYHVVKATCQWDESPQLCGLQLGHNVMSMATADPDGDGAITVTSANAAIEPRQILKSYRWISPSTECMTVTFADPVQVQTLTGVHTVTELTFWRNLDGNPLGKTKPKPTVVKTTGLPPGTPYIGNRTIPIRLPAVESSGNGIVRADVGAIRAGVHVTSTWARAWSSAKIQGELDEKMSAQHSSMFRPERSALEAYATDPNCPGFVCEFDDSPPALIWSPRSNILLYGRGDMAGMPSGSDLNGIELEEGGGLSTVIRYVPGNVGGHALATLTMAGWEVGSAEASEVEVSQRYRIVLEADIDADGQYEIVCMFAPGTTATLPGQPPVAIDKLVFTPVAPDRPILHYSAAVLDLEQLPPGIPIEGITMAQMMAPGSTVDVPPAKPPIAGLELRGVMPNPARGASTVRLALERDSRIRVQVLDVAGREVARLADGVRPAGEHTFTWSGVTNRGSKAAAGLYLVRVSGDGLITRTTRMIRLD